MAYKVEEYNLTKANDFKMLILVIPEEEVEDKLAYLAREKGAITKSLYEDWLIANCVANINQLLYSINRGIEQNSDDFDLMAARDELVNCIVKFNPLLDPNGLVINSNHVIKIKIKDKELAEGEKLLVDNKHWNNSYYDEENKPEEPNTTITLEKPENSKILKKTKSDDELKSIDQLEYKITQKWWSRIGQYVKIRVYNEDDAESILRSKFFHSSTSFRTFIVTICVEDFEALFSMLDNMGVPNRVSAPILMKELYDLCNEVNKFLTFENCRNMVDDLEDDGEEETSNTKATSGAMSQFAKNSKRKVKKKLFKDVSKEDLLRLADKMKVFLIGQDKAVDLLAESIQRASVGLKDPNKPIGSFLFAGRTGCGKTLATKVLADELIRSRDNMVTIDCSEYSSDHEYAKLIGAPAGYVGHENGGMLTNAVAKNPFSVIVFDEVEKASHKVHELLLQILEEGRLTDGKGSMVSFKDTVVILTSNIGVREVEDIKKTVGFGDVAKITETKKESALNRALKRKFKPEFLNRLDAIVHFNTLSKNDYMRIIDLELYKLNDNLKTNDTEYKNITLEFDDRIKSLIFEKGIDEQYGARPLKREIEKLISTPLAKRLLTEPIESNSVVKVSANRKKVVFDILEPAGDNIICVENPPFYMTGIYDLDNNTKIKTAGK